MTDSGSAEARVAVTVATCIYPLAHRCLQPDKLKISVDLATLHM